MNGDMDRFASGDPPVPNIFGPLPQLPAIPAIPAQWAHHLQVAAAAVPANQPQPACPLCILCSPIVMRGGPGNVLAGTPIVVDFWYLRHCPPSAQLFFLTHMHADHFMGLTPSWNLPIYCTPITKQLLLLKIQFTAGDIVRELELNESHALKYGNEDETLTVTPLHANHCAGAAMFLFEGQFGRILYTGDFRYSGPMLNDDKLDSACSAGVDVLYIDNTFCDARCVFPTREQAILEIFDIVRSNPDAQIKIGLKNLGKEEMLVALARGVGEWIGVSLQKQAIVVLLGMSNVFMVSELCRIQAVMVTEITVKNMNDWNRQQRTVAIIPSAIGVALDCIPFPHREDVRLVPYSDHCSYPELQEFVALVQPRRIYPIIGPNVNDRLSRSIPNRSNMSCFQVNGYCATDEDCIEENSAVGSNAGLSQNMRNADNSLPKVSAKKRRRQRGQYSFKKKPQMGVVFSSSQSPSKCTETVAENADTPAEIKPAALSEGDSPADTVGSVAVKSEQISDTDCKTTDIELNKNNDTNDSGPVRPGDRVESLFDFDSVDNAWMLDILEPLISREAERISLEQQQQSCVSITSHVL